ncbi:MAG: hypothetical protein LH702_33285 [Phormidesmis sp. CAN_BIN44]|nr:hypothetical protein [Phormidesmis sp. CAN_BIN44]
MPQFSKRLGSRSFTQVQPPLGFIAPDLGLTVVNLVQRTLPLWMRFKTPLTRVEAGWFQGLKREMRMDWNHPKSSRPCPS